MLDVVHAAVTCPYCGEGVELLVDCPEGRHEYVEDCQVCCRPMAIEVVVELGRPVRISASHEDDV